MPRNIAFFLLLVLFSCADNKVVDKITVPAMEDSLAIPQVTILADLSDSLQPETIFLEDRPKPKTLQIPDKSVSFVLKQKSGTRDLSVGATQKIKASLSPVFEHYTTEQGLAQDVTSYAFMDHKGNLWFGTHTSGMSKYDGHSFTNYTTSHGLPKNDINGITEDKAGNIWVSTSLGASKFDGTAFSTFGEFKDVQSILEDTNGNLWFATWNGLYKYSDDSITRYSQSDGLIANRVTGLMQDPNGLLWIGTDNGFFSYDHKTFTHVGLNKKYIHTICNDKNGDIWVGIPEGYAKYDGAQITNYPFITQSFRHMLYSDRRGGVWLDGGQKGMFYYDAKSSSIINIISEVIVGRGSTITEDKSGNIWFATSGDGVVKYSGSAFQQLITASVRSIMEDHSGNLWFAGYGPTICRFDGEYFTRFGLSSNIWCLAQDTSGSIWMGSADDDGLIQLENDSLTYFTDLNGLAHNSPKFIMQDSKGHLWIGTTEGLSRFDGKSFTNYTQKQGLAGDYISHILEDKPGELLICTDGGLSIFDGASMTNLTISRTIPQRNDLRSLVKDEAGNLWIGTYGGGLCRYDGKSFYTYTTEQGLPDNVVTQVTLTKEEHIIIGTNNGIALLTGFRSTPHDNPGDSNGDQESNIPAQNKLNNSELRSCTPIFEIYNPKTGYPVMDVNRGQHGIYEDSKGILWIASGSENSGLMRFDYSSLNKNSNPPTLNILSVKVDNELVCWHDLLNPDRNDKVPASEFETITVPASVAEEVTTFGKKLSDDQRKEVKTKFSGIEFDAVRRFYPVPENLKLPYRHNNISIEFAAIEPDKPRLVHYQYMLEGYNANWSTPANVTSATFGNMREGTYHFKLKARSPSGVWSEPITYSFTVLPPWWRTWWARSVWAIALIGVLVGFFRYRTRALRKRQKELEEEVSRATLEIKKQKEEVELAMENLKAAQEELVKSEKLAAFGKMATRMAHEIQNPLNFVNNFSEVSRQLIEDINSETIPEEEKLEAINTLNENLEKIYHHGKRASEIIRQLEKHNREGTTHAFFEE